MNPLNLRQLMDKTFNGELVLPEFQRSFIWEPDNIIDLLISVLGDIFIGSMLTIDSTKEGSPFALRLIEGVEQVNEKVQIPDLVKILLDGQQRTTALFYALYEVDIPLKNRKNSYKFYLNIDAALNEKWDDAVIAVIRRDKKELARLENSNDFMPISLIKDIWKISKRFRDHPEFEKIIELANNFMNRQIHIVNLPLNTSLDKIVETFEKINRTGVPLSIFELLTARLYKYGINLRDMLENTRNEYSFASEVQPEFILKVIALIRNIEPKRKNILEFSPENFLEDWETACESLELAYKRILDIKNGYGVLNFKKWAPYSTMIVPLAAMLYYVKHKKLENKLNYEKIDRWYWTTVLSKRYDQAVDANSYYDFRSFIEWIENEKVPQFIKEFKPAEVDFEVDNQSSAVYRGLISLIVLNGAYDFKTGLPPQFEMNKVQNDHIFPKSVFNENRILNRTLISTNQSKIDKRPSEYFAERIKEIGEHKVKEILKTHLIPEEAIDFLLRDDLENFMESRKQCFIEEIKKRTGK